MKKNLLVAVLSTVCVTGTACGMYINHIIDSYEDKLEYCNNEYAVLESYCDQKITAYNKIKNDYDELQNEVYKVMNGEDYHLTIYVDSKAHTYLKEKQNFLFSTKTHIY